MGASEWRLIGNLADIPKSGARRVRIGEVEVGVFRTANDQLFALEDVCPHLGGPLSEGIVHGNSVTCPLHNLVIDLESGQSVDPEPKCVRSCMIRLEGEQIFLSDPDLRELASKQLS